MANKEDHMTTDEADMMIEKIDAVGSVLDNTPAHIVLHVLMNIAAEIGVQAKDKLTKREFVADCVECLDFWYEDWEEQDE